eukprot:2891540-Alexandrium_andersonii.AAC.1
MKLLPEHDQRVAAAQQKDALLVERSEDINKLTIAHANVREEHARVRLAYGADIERAKADAKRELFSVTGECEVLKRSVASLKEREDALNAEILALRARTFALEAAAPAATSGADASTDVAE